MRIDPAGWPFIGGSLALAALAALLVGGGVAVIFLVLTGVFQFLLPDPPKPITTNKEEVKAPPQSRVIV